jgi:hypothetical protein
MVIWKLTFQSDYYVHIRIALIYSTFLVIARATRPNKQREAKPSTHLTFSWHTLKLSFFFWYFWLKIQNTTNRHVRNAFGLIAVFISFSGITESLAFRPRAAGSSYQLRALPFFWENLLNSVKRASYSRRRRRRRRRRRLVYTYRVDSFQERSAAWVPTLGY